MQHVRMKTTHPAYSIISFPPSAKKCLEAYTMALDKQLQVLMVVVTYTIISIAMVFLNKTLGNLTPLFITWYQCVITGTCTDGMDAQPLELDCKSKDRATLVIVDLSVYPCGSTSSRSHSLHLHPPSTLEIEWNMFPNLTPIYSNYQCNFRRGGATGK